MVQQINLSVIPLVNKASCINMVVASHPKGSQRGVTKREDFMVAAI